MRLQLARMAKSRLPKRAGFFCELPVSTISTIKRRSSATKPQWKVIQEAVEGIKVAAPAKKKFSGPGVKGSAKITKSIRK